MLSPSVLPDLSLAQRLLPDLLGCLHLYQDVHIWLGQSQDPYRSNSLLLAALSPSFAESLSSVENEDPIHVIVPEVGITSDDLDIFFTALFDCNFGRQFPTEDCLKSIENVLDFFSITFKLDDVPRTQLPKPKVLKIETAKTQTCDQCQSNFANKKLLRRHKRIVHSENPPHVCKECGRSCRGPAELVIHQRIHSKEKPFICDCGKTFAQKSQLNDHVHKVHYLKRIGSNVCQICGQVLASGRAVKRHVIQVHSRIEKCHQKFGIKKPEEEVTDSVEEEVSKSLSPSDRIYICPEQECGKSFKSGGSLKLHAVCHTGKKEFPCPHCGKEFSQQSHLNVHVQTLHLGAKPHMCSVCGKQFSIKSNLKKHLKMHERKRLEEIDEEGDGQILRVETFGLDQNSVVTIEKVSVEVKLETDFRFICEVCGQAFIDESNLASHSRSHENQSYSCKICQMNFETWSAKRIHEKEHVGGEQHSCPACNLVCVSKSALAKHELTHTGLRPHACTFEGCDKHFIQKSHLNHHLKTVHGPPVGSRPRPYSCLICYSTFTTNSSLRKHQKTHTNDRPHECQICGKRFIQKVHLETHILRHTGDRPFSCSECSRSFSSRSGLTEHSKVHSGEKKIFTCSEPGCEAQYASSFDLKVHQRKHTGETPFGCQTCSRSFRSKRLLDDHSRIHTGVVPFVCKNCSKTFTTASGLRQHFRRHDTCRLAVTPGSFSLGSTTFGLADSKTSLILNDAETTLLSDSLLVPIN